MILIGCDFHPSWQQVCWVDTETGETEEHKLVVCRGGGEVLPAVCRPPALIGLESTGNCQWFVEMVDWDWATRCGSAMRPRSGPATCGSRSTTGEMRRLLLPRCSVEAVFRISGRRRI